MKKVSLIIVLLFSLSVTFFSLVYAEESSTEANPSSEIPEKVQTLITKLSSTERNERREAAIELREMGKSAAHAVPCLINLLRDEDWYVRKDAIFGLSLICDERAEKHLIMLMNEDPVPAVRKAAEKALDIMKSKSNDKGTCEF